MAAEPLNEPGLAAALSDAKADYEHGWKLVDNELYELCRRPRHADFDNVYPKVAIIGRVYSAGVSRAWGRKRDSENRTTQVLIGQAGRIGEGLRRLHGRPFGQQVAGDVVELHRDVAEAIRGGGSEKYLTSFVSKYLHFHCPIVPIFDSDADAAIGQLVHRRRKRVQKALAELPEGVWAYRSFVAAFVVLQERFTEMNLEPSVKELDHLLWRLKFQRPEPSTDPA